jgi:hypothetical protein
MVLLNERNQQKTIIKSADMNLSCHENMAMMNYSYKANHKQTRFKINLIINH